MRHQEFERLYEAHAQPLFGFLVYRTGNRMLAEDLLGDTFERVLRGRRGFDRRKASEKTWLYTIALNCLRDHARRQAAEGRALERKLAQEPDHELESALEGVDRHDDLYRALETLSAEEREAIALRFGADLTVPEIAKFTKEPLTTVEGRVYRALRKLRAELNIAGDGRVRSGTRALARISR
jgi:RNA polymerase sigma-70 factor (ECF subfamily)